eukprot:7389238-Prymnesium_polylepis.2
MEAELYSSDQLALYSDALREPHTSDHGSSNDTCVAGTDAVRSTGNVSAEVSPSGRVARYLAWSLPAKRTPQ